MSLFVPGLVSVTFRQLTPSEIIPLVARGGLKAIEWGGDVHVPHGELAKAKDIGRRTVEGGLSVAAYGSYYRLGASEAKGLPFSKVLDTAVALGAPTIRVWAGERGSATFTDPERAAIVADALRVADLAQAVGLSISLEYHLDTLTDTRESVQRLMEELPHASIKFLWQSSHGESEESNVARLREVLPRAGHIHVFHWPVHGDWRALVEGEARWKHYLAIFRAAGQPRACLLEFVRGHAPEQFLEDAATLRGWIE